MANLHIFSAILIILFLTTGEATPRKTLEAAATAPSSSIGEVVAQIIAECGSNLSIGCGDLLRDSLYTDVELTETCCENLVFMGPDCHYKFVELSLYAHPKANVSLIFDRAVEIWDVCLSLVTALPPVTDTPTI